MGLDFVMDLGLAGRLGQVTGGRLRANGMGTRTEISKIMNANSEAKNSNVNWTAIFGGLGLVIVGLGVADVGGDVTSGICRGVGAVFLFLAATVWVASKGIAPEH